MEQTEWYHFSKNIVFYIPCSCTVILDAYPWIQSKKGDLIAFEEPEQGQIFTIFVASYHHEIVFSTNIHFSLPCNILCALFFQVVSLSVFMMR